MVTFKLPYKWGVQNFFVQPFWVIPRFKRQISIKERDNLQMPKPTLSKITGCQSQTVTLSRVYLGLMGPEPWRINHTSQQNSKRSEIAIEMDNFLLHYLNSSLSVRHGPAKNITLLCSPLFAPRAIRRLQCHKNVSILSPYPFILMNNNYFAIPKWEDIADPKVVIQIYFYAVKIIVIFPKFWMGLCNERFHWLQILL